MFSGLFSGLMEVFHNFMEWDAHKRRGLIKAALNLVHTILLDVRLVSKFFLIALSIRHPSSRLSGYCQIKLFL